MNLFNRLFRRKPQDVPPERTNACIATMDTYLRGIMSHYGMEHFQGDSQAKQVLSVYSFVGVFFWRYEYPGHAAAINSAAGTCRLSGLVYQFLWLQARRGYRESRGGHYRHSRSNFAPVCHHSPRGGWFHPLAAAFRRRRSQGLRDGDGRDSEGRGKGITKRYSERMVRDSALILFGRILFFMAP